MSSLIGIDWFTPTWSSDGNTTLECKLGDFFVGFWHQNQNAADLVQLQDIKNVTCKYNQLLVENYSDCYWADSSELATTTNYAIC